MAVTSMPSQETADADEEPKVVHHAPARGICGNPYVAVASAVNPLASEITNHGGHTVRPRGPHRLLGCAVSSGMNPHAQC